MPFIWPSWSPDGTQLAFAADRPTRKDVLVRRIDSAGSERRLVVREGLQWPSDWTSTGYLVFTDVPLDEDRDIWVVKADGSAPPFPYLDTPFLERGGDVSPDGRWIAYNSNAPGRFEVFVNTFPRPAASPVIVSSGGGTNPRWGPDGRELFYWNGQRLIAVRLDLTTRPRVVSRSPVLQAPYAPADHPNFDVHPDGKRLVVVTGGARPQRIIVALHPLAALPRTR
jgi:Tol biopolymer transport system component